MEMRTITEPIAALREDGAPPVLSGYAAVFNTRVSIGNLFDESIDRRAFNRVLTEKQDVKALFDHKSEYVLGRTANGTLTLSVDQHGLRDEIKLNDKVSYARDLIENIQRNDIYGQSFAFTVARERWDFSNDVDVRNHRIILEIERLYDVGPVTYPAYDTTSVAARHEEVRAVFGSLIHKVPDVHGLEIVRNQPAIDFQESEGRNYITGSLDKIETYVREVRTKKRSQKFKWIKERTRLAEAENLY